MYCYCYEYLIVQGDIDITQCGHAQSKSKVGIAEVDIDVVKLSRLNRYRYISYPGDLPLQATLTLTPIGGDGR